MEKQSQPLLIDNINFNNINIDRVDIENDNRKNLYLTYNNNNFIIQTPELFYNDELKEMDEYYEILIDLVCKNKEKTTKFITFLNNLDKYFITLISKSKNKYFNNKNIKYKSILREKNNKKFIKLKLLKHNVNNNILRIVNNNNSISLEELNNNCYLKMLININAIWINNNIFGIYLKPILINKRSIINNNISFIKDSETEKSILDSNIDSNINSINNLQSSILKQKKHVNTEKVLISNNNSSIKSKNTDTSTVTISSMSNNNNHIDMSTISFTTLDNIPEYDNDTKNDSNTSL